MRIDEYKNGIVPWYICQGGYMKMRLEAVETLFKALADTTRLRILGLLPGEIECGLGKFS